MNEVVIITGASSGIGNSIAKLLSKKGYKVYGLSRSNFELEGVTHLQGDVTDEEKIQELFRYVYEKEGRVDILINNAGMGISGSIESTSLNDVKNIFNVNFIGSFITTKTILPFMRERKYGKIINVGSVASEFAIPFQAFYSSSKAALKTFSEALRNEVIQYGIQVSTILPGDIKTNFTKNRRKNEIEPDEYKKRVIKSIDVMEKDEQNGMTVEYAAKVIFKVIKKKRIPVQKTIGHKYKILLFIKRLLPTKLVNNLIGKIYAFKKEKWVKVKKESMFLKAIVSGVYVTFAAVVYLFTVNTTGSKLLGGLLFSFALLAIVGRGYYLYTGKIGYLLPYKKGNLKMIGITLLGNMTGIVITGSLLLIAKGADLTPLATPLIDSKFYSHQWYETLILAFFCGILMYTAVDGYYKITDPLIRVLIVIFSVILFLISGYEHCIANMVYIVLAKKFSFQIFGYLLLMILGNALGAVVFNLIHHSFNKNTELSK